ncbi:hypothetical protein QSJ19_03190 [Gordonia sp. ABSL11-1]|uniref:hypothetical protein n=1 Tax=Gordonia sp. ABSL11-1 TaxID=3053924 RepID=UPI0025734567|nr:hypothetical protein [Gordonia sp. ABSL11-1]MDL9944604.1 hypothetical protein [Gordonia sp. ABSL11-1]
MSKLMPSVDHAFKAFESPAVKMMLDALQPKIGTFDLGQAFALNLPAFRLDLPPLGLDYGRLFGPAINLENLAFKNAVDPASFTAFKEIYETQRRQFETIFDLDAILKAIDAAYPPNWKGVKSGEMAKLESLLLDEGLALGWVPEAEILQKLFDAATKQERRRLLGRRWKTVMKSCRASVSTVAQTKYSGYRDFTLKAIDALEAGSPEAAQALAASLLDTMLRETLDVTDRTLVTAQRNRLDLNSLPLRASIVFGGIWGSFTEFYTSRGDKVPQNFSRHASAHAVGGRQYSRINTVIAIMHVTAYLMLLESGDLDT